MRRHVMPLHSAFRACWCNVSWESPVCVQDSEDECPGRRECEGLHRRPSHPPPCQQSYKRYNPPSLRPPVISLGQIPLQDGLASRFFPGGDGKEGSTTGCG